jgi:hypothetical protein
MSRNMSATQERYYIILWDKISAVSVYAFLLKGSLKLCYTWNTIRIVSTILSILILILEVLELWMLSPWDISEIMER